MDKILELLFTGNQKEAFEKILEIYHRQGHCVVDYLYFANIHAKKMFESQHISYDISSFKELLLDGYKKKEKKQIFAAYLESICQADVVLPDGIALQIFYYLARRRWLCNLNGTDFAPYVLESLVQKFGTKKVRILLHGTYPHLLQKTKIFLQDKGYQVVYAQDGYTDLDRNQVKHTLSPYDGSINVLLVARSTPQYPIQEIWTYANQQNIIQCNLLVMNQGGTFDRWVGDQKRPPKLIRMIKLERFWRLLADPKRNYKKVLDSLGIIVYIFRYLLLKKKSR